MAIALNLAHVAFGWPVSVSGSNTALHANTHAHAHIHIAMNFMGNMIAQLTSS